MPLAAHRDLDSPAVRELQELRDVLRVAGPEHGSRLFVHDMSEVVGRRLQRCIIEGPLSAEVLQVIAQRLRYSQPIPRRLQRKECRAAREPLAEVAARDTSQRAYQPTPVPAWRKRRTRRDDDEF